MVGTSTTTTVGYYLPVVVIPQITVFHRDSTDMYGCAGSKMTLSHRGKILFMGCPL